MKSDKGKVLIIDDHKTVLKALLQILEPEFGLVHGISNPNLLPGLITKERFDVYLLDMNFSAGKHTGNEGLYWLREIHKYDPKASVVLITAYGDVNLAVTALKEGATDFVLKPWDNDRLIATLRSALKLSQSQREVDSLKNRQIQLTDSINKNQESIIGSSSCMNEIFETINKVSKTDANILILGENGTGKELIAREIHNRSKRLQEIFLSVDMGSISESLFESEIFGHKKGAFTDAKEERAGRFETASGGSLFLDEIANLSMYMQAKLLRVLESRQITKLGSNKAIDIDIRLICATNKNIRQMVDQNLFREDLLYRINTIEIMIPPLRERGDDIIILANHFLAKYTLKYEKSRLRISQKAFDKLLQYQWPGNVRELQHTIEKAVIMSDSEILGPEDFFIRKEAFEYTHQDVPVSFSEIERSAIMNALKNNNGSVYKAAKELKLARQTVYNKMIKYGLDE